MSLATLCEKCGAWDLRFDGGAVVHLLGRWPVGVMPPWVHDRIEWPCQ